MGHLRRLLRAVVSSLAVTAVSLPILLPTAGATDGQTTDGQTPDGHTADGQTIDGQSAGGGSIGAGARIDLVIAGRGGVPASGR